MLMVGDIRTSQDFLSHDHGGPFDLIVTNPPYSQAFEFARQRALTCGPRRAL
jgi:methylase of polypeptide subunit release factors